MARRRGRRRRSLRRASRAPGRARHLDGDGDRGYQRWRSKVQDRMLEQRLARATSASGPGTSRHAYRRPRTRRSAPCTTRDSRSLSSLPVPSAWRASPVSWSCSRRDVRP